MAVDDIIYEDSKGPINIGKDYGLANLVTGAVAASAIVASGALANDAWNISGFLESKLGSYFSAGLFYNPYIAFFAGTAGFAHGLGEAGSREKVLSGVALGVSYLYSLKETLDTVYHGLSIPYWMIQSTAGNFTLGAAVLAQAAVPVLAVFGLSYTLARLMKWGFEKIGHKRVTKRERK